MQLYEYKSISFSVSNKNKKNNLKFYLVGKGYESSSPYGYNWYIRKRDFYQTYLRCSINWC